MSNPLSQPHKSHLIFDFDGTLVDSFACAVKVFNTLAEEHHFRPILPEEIATLRNLDSKAWVHLFKVPFYKLPILIYQAAQHMRHDILTLQPFIDIPPVISQLHAQGYELSIVSSNSEQNVKTWLAHHHLSPFFHSIINAPHYFGKAKTLKRMIKQGQHPKEKICYIGDETRDIEAAKQSNIDSLAVTWGFQTETLLLQHHPNYLAHSPYEILEAFLYSGKTVDPSV